MLARLSASSGDRGCILEVVTKCARSLPCWGGLRRVREIVTTFGRSSLSSGGRCCLGEVVAEFGRLLLR